MAKGLITHAYLEDTADAIRVLRGESDTYTPDEFGEKIIDAIPTEEVTDSIVSVNDAAAYPAEGLEFGIEPVQDLHGYDKPWPAGGGKNLFVSAIGKTETLNGITISTNGDGIYSISGTASAYTIIRFPLKQTFTIPASDNYNMHLKNTFGNYNVILYFMNGTTVIDYWQIDPIDRIATAWSAMTGRIVDTLEVRITQNTTVNGTFSPMLLLKTESDTSYEPYSNICPISGWTGVNGDRTGKNLFDKNTSNVLNGYLNSIGQMVYTSEGEKCVVSDLLPAGTYTVSKVSTTRFRVGAFLTQTPTAYQTPLIYVDGSPLTATSITISINQPAYLIAYVLNSSGEEHTLIDVLNSMQIELGSTATSYEPYQGTSIPVSFPAAAGTVYGGKAKPLLGKLVDGMAEVDLGTLDWVYYANVIPPQFRASLNPAPNNISADKKSLAYCSEYPIVSHSELADKTAAIFYASKNGINICDLRYNNEEDFKAAMQGVQLVYELATPIEYDITPQQVQMLLGDNNVWCDTGDTTLEYKVDLGRYIAKLQAAQATPQLSLSRQAVSLDAAGDDEVSADEDEAGDLR